MCSSHAAATLPAAKSHPSNTGLTDALNHDALQKNAKKKLKKKTTHLNPHHHAPTHDALFVQVNRRTLQHKLTRVAQLLAAKDVPGRTEEEETRIVEDLRREITALWQTDELRRRKPTALEGEKGGHLFLPVQYLQFLQKK